VRIDAVGVRTTIRTGKGKPERVLLDDISLAIHPGELVAIVGGSGAGKTTLLNALAGVNAPTGGHVSYNGEDLYENPPPPEARSATSPDDIVHPELTVERTLQYAARLRLSPETTTAERDAIVRTVIEALGLTAQAGQRVSTLSGGQRKRTSIGVELLTKPGVLFLDEPTSGLDPATGRTMMRLLRRLAEDGHGRPDHARTPDIGLCDRVLSSPPAVGLAGPPREAIEYLRSRALRRSTSAWRGCRWRGSPRSAVRAAPRRTPSLPLPAESRRPPLRHAGRSGGLRALRHGPRSASAPWRRCWQPAHAGDPPAHRPGNRDVRGALPSRRLRSREPQPERDADILLTGSPRRLLGLTYGLLMISHQCRSSGGAARQPAHCTLCGKGDGAVPVLATVIVFMLGTLRLRSPTAGAWNSTARSRSRCCSSRRSRSLPASAAVTRPEQATLALPMIRFRRCSLPAHPLVLAMADAGRISWLMTDRWVLEALGRE
jgi:ABC-type lipoprotein export system ATPase subunit